MRADEPGELVHRGALVAHGLLERSGEDRRALQAAARGRREPGLVLPEIAVFSGDTVRATTRASCTSSAAATR